MANGNWNQTSGGTFWRTPVWPNPSWLYGNCPFLTHPALKVNEMLRTQIPPLEMRSATTVFFNRRPARGTLGQGYIINAPQAGNGAQPLVNPMAPLPVPTPMQLLPQPQPSNVSPNVAIAPAGATPGPPTPLAPPTPAATTIVPVSSGISANNLMFLIAAGLAVFYIGKSLK